MSNVTNHIPHVTISPCQMSTLTYDLSLVTCYMPPFLHVPCHMSPVTCQRSHVNSDMSHITCHMSYVTISPCHMSPVTYDMSPVTCYMSPFIHVPCHMSPVTCHLLHESYQLLYVTCHLSHVPCHHISMSHIKMSPPTSDTDRSLQPTDLLLLLFNTRPYVATFCGVMLCGEVIISATCSRMILSEVVLCG